MSGSDTPPLPGGYPDPAVVGWIRSDDIEFAGFHIRLTITPGSRIVELWITEDGHPVVWLGNAHRVDSEPPGLHVNHSYSKQFNRAQRDALAREAAKFWKS
ncbi:hypothetical protein [Glycomyces paridis]|uniref:Uncharacterized protein n=1 Tax=Glycomyces paridis TaxID=2126555 RepID=A0A4S8P9Y3_9ACTN|nr:hypothetical protein [Glycomyces paridis]THV25962.1 hypothetical protein E9998_19710 [Glycomyces paridis]